MKRNFTKDGTATMTEQWNGNNPNGCKRREQSKHTTSLRSIKLFLAWCCCLTIIIIGLYASNFTYTIDEQPSIPFSTNDVAPNTDFDTNGITDEQSNDDEAEWYLILVNKWNCIPSNYEVELMELSNGQLVDNRVYPALQEMFNAARDDGVYPVVVSGYRSAEKQQSLMDDKIAEYRALGYSDEKAKTKAEEWVAIPGTSEHQLGIAVDINADGFYSAGNEVYAWLDKNAHKYGFIYRYPSDKTEITGVIDEPWHYRYVGIPAAMEIYNQGVCLEEYLNIAN
jgi:D-alanyl-D-alanine carboxypeptidase